ncbi:hypothetical protein [Reyranella sp.]|uniref:hypothetical protein n=1 Tax=Reyranella sp. TaxID=1929291 RepID=UPI00403505A4
MRPLARRALFALPLVAPLAVAAAAQATPSRVSTIKKFPLPRVVFNKPFFELTEISPVWPRFELRRFDTIGEAFDALERESPSRSQLATTLGIPHEEPHVWTDDEVALTLGIDVQRDGIVISAATVRT